MKRYGITQSMLPLEGVKFGLQDLTYIQQGILDNDIAFVKSQLPDTFTATTPVIIEGCKITKVSPTQYSWDAGTIYYDGMFYTVFAGVLNTANASVVPKWVVNNTPVGQYARNLVIPFSTNSIIQVNKDAQMVLAESGLFDYDKNYTLKYLTSLNAWTFDDLRMVHSLDLSDFTSGVGKAFGKYAGWGLADGQGGRPDLRGRFVVGKSTVAGNYFDLLNTGGAEMVTLSANESGLREHGHTANSSQTAHDHSFNLTSRGYAGGVSVANAYSHKASI
ncbi:MAG: hypothetical protein EAZ27_04480 [Cytophagales bacterium]|nr:MAG: hypothetical protein EAZ27_04480 [Cytophagales bacterium]